MGRDFAADRLAVLASQESIGDAGEAPVGNFRTIGVFGGESQPTESVLQWVRMD